MLPCGCGSELLSFSAQPATAPQCKIVCVQQYKLATTDGPALALQVAGTQLSIGKGAGSALSCASRRVRQLATVGASLTCKRPAYPSTARAPKPPQVSTAPSTVRSSSSTITLPMGHHFAPLASPAPCLSHHCLSCRLLCIALSPITVTITHAHFMHSTSHTSIHFLQAAGWASQCKSDSPLSFATQHGRLLPGEGSK